jgi:hypothetical protein
MARNFKIIQTNTVSYDEEFAKDMTEAYEALKNAPTTSIATTECETSQEAYQFGRMATEWAKDNGLKYTRKPVPGYDNIKDLPLTVAFRVYTPRAKGE